MPLRINEILVKGLRGIPELHIEAKGKSIVIKGENGTGKSSVVDALEFFFTGNIKHLEGTRGISLQKHGPHLKHSCEDSTIFISFNQSNLSFTRKLSTPELKSEGLLDLFQKAENGAFILRRSQLLEFIVSQPADRFRTIGNIIGIGDLDPIELEMMRVRDELKDSKDAKQNEISKILGDLRHKLDAVVNTSNDILPALNVILAKNNLPELSSFKEVSQHAEEMYKKVKNSEKLDVVNELAEIKKAADFILQYDNISDEINKINLIVKNLMTNYNINDLSRKELWEKGTYIIKNEGLDYCPLCNQSINEKQLLIDLENRLKILIEITESSSQINMMIGLIENQIDDTLRKLSKLISTIEQNTLFTNYLNLLKTTYQNLREFYAELELAKKEKKELVILDFQSLQSEINDATTSIKRICLDLIEKKELSEEEKRLLEIVSLLQHVSDKASKLEETKSELTKVESLLAISEKIFSTFSNVKKSKTQKVYDSLKSEIDRFFSFLHPNEPHRNIELKVLPGRRGSAQLIMDSFDNKGEDPRALSSEGHLDSLGLCIFLAFVKNINTDLPFIVLDDVVTTIDSTHRMKIADLLLKEFNDYQMFITTHDNIWFDQLVNAQRTYKVQSKYLNLEFFDWNINDGPKIKNYLPKWERIVKKLDDNDKSAGNDARKFLEASLKDICERMHTPIVFKRNGRYEIGDLFDPIENRLKEKLKNSEFKSKLDGIFVKLRNTIPMSNLLSHDNPEFDNLSLGEVRDFCNAVNELHNAFFCPTCQKPIIYDKQSKLLRCDDLRCSNPLKIDFK